MDNEASLLDKKMLDHLQGPRTMMNRKTSDESLVFHIIKKLLVRWVIKEFRVMSLSLSQLTRSFGAVQQFPPLRLGEYQDSLAFVIQESSRD